MYIFFPLKLKLLTYEIFVNIRKIVYKRTNRDLISQFIFSELTFQSKMLHCMLTKYRTIYAMLEYVTYILGALHACYLFFYTTYEL